LQNKKDAGAGCAVLYVAFVFREIMSLLSDCCLTVVERRIQANRREFAKWAVL